MNKRERVSSHLKKYWPVYLGSVIGVAGITWGIMKENRVPNLFDSSDSVGSLSNPEIGSSVTGTGETSGSFMNPNLERTCIRPISGADVHTTNPQKITGSLFVSGVVHGNVNNTYVGNGNTMSKIISCDQTGEWFRSQAEAARHFGITESALSKHLNKGEAIPNFAGSFTREGLAA